MRVLWIWLATACSASTSDVGGAAAADGGFVGCLSANECPAGTICNEFGRCVPPPSG